MASNTGISLVDLADNENLQFHHQINDLKEWFHRVGMANRRRFMIGLTQRLDETDMLKYLVHVLNRVLGKDYTYTRSRTNPSLLTDSPSELSDHALGQKYIDHKISECLEWFEHSSKTNKSTFLFSLLGQCDVQLLHGVANAAKSMVATEWAVKQMKETSAHASGEHPVTPSMVYTDPLGYTTRRTTNHTSSTLRVKSAPNLTVIYTAPSATDLQATNNDQNNQTATSTDRLQSPSGSGPERKLSVERVKSSVGGRTRVSVSKMERVKSPASSRLTTYDDSTSQRPTSRSASRISANPSTIYSQTFRDEDDAEFASICVARSTETTFMVHPGTAKGYSGTWDTCDYVQELPIHLAKYILSFLDVKSMKSAEYVSKFWKLVIGQVRKERDVLQQVKDDSLFMQGGAAEGINPVYANDVDVPVPVIDTTSMEVLPPDDLTSGPSNTTPYFWEGYRGCQTRNVVMEERNVFCGTYNVMIVIDKEDDSRVVHTDGEYIATATGDRKIRLHDKTTGHQFGPTINGHAGTVRCLYVDRQRGFVLSGSYDTTLRHWDAETGECLRIYQGHQGTVMSIRVWNNLLVSASRDKTCKVWDLSSGELVRTYRHQSAVTSVAIGEYYCVSGDDSGVVKVWENESGKLIKVLKGHTATVTAIMYDKWHIVTCSKDSYALLWSVRGKHKKSLTALRHQKAVLCVELLYLRVVTGSEDGRIRIWNALTGHCCRIMRGNSRSDPVLSLTVIGKIITINTRSNVIRLNFEAVDWDYAMSKDHIPPMFTYGQYSDLPVKHRSHSYVRAKRIKISGTPNNMIPRKDIRRVRSACAIGLQRKLQKQPSVVVKTRVKSAHFADDEGSLGLTVQNLEDVRSVAPPRGDSESSIAEETTNRRMSWGFDRVPTPPEESKDLNQTKALWRQQIRNPCPLHVSHLTEETPIRKRERPNSSPPKVDPRLRMPVSQIHSELGHQTRKPMPSDRSERSVAVVVSKPPPSESKSYLAKIESSKSKLIPKSTPIFVPARPRTAAPSPSCRLSQAVVHSPFKDPLRLKQAFHLKTHEQETS